MAKRFSFIGIYLVLQQNDERMRSIVKIGEERKKLSNLSTIFPIIPLIISRSIKWAEIWIKFYYAR